MTVPRVASRADAASHLSPVALSMLRALLLCQLVNLLAQAQEHREVLADLADPAAGDTQLERELADISAIRADEAVAEIRLALDRLDRGAYGRCEQCPEPIPLERLEAIPHARLCIACSERSRGFLN